MRKKVVDPEFDFSPKYARGGGGGFKSTHVELLGAEDGGALPRIQTHPPHYFGGFPPVGA